MKQFTTKVRYNDKIAKRYRTLSFKIPQNTKVEPGQFFNVRISDEYRPLLRRPFGAHKIEKDKIEILYKIVGEATEFLSKKKKNQKLDIIGPLGNGFSIGEKEAILVGGGHGVAPLFALAKVMVENDTKVSILIGGRSKEDILSLKDFKEIGVKTYIATEDGSAGKRGVVTSLLEDMLRMAKANRHKVSIYACGPKSMLESVSKIAIRRTVPCQVSLEAYMACGIGTCMGCAVQTKDGYKMVCKDGPVFEAKDIIWQA